MTLLATSATFVMAVRSAVRRLFALSSTPLLGAFVAVNLAGCGAALNWNDETTGYSSPPNQSTRQATPSANTATSRAPQRKKRLSSSAARPATYQVKSGDTLYSIAYVNRIDYRDLAMWNGRQGHYRIFVGETLLLQPKTSSTNIAKRPTVNSPPVQYEEPARGGYNEPSLGQPPQSDGSVVWQWPATGAVVAFDAAQQGRLKGLLIKGKTGQPIRAAAAGKVVYAGSGLPSYGRLIIVQHSTSYFSAYAYNQKIYVKQGEAVSAGQSIATMGKIPGEKDSALRFDIRVGTESIDPEKLLPTRRSNSA